MVRPIFRDMTWWHDLGTRSQDTWAHIGFAILVFVCCLGPVTRNNSNLCMYRVSQNKTGMAKTWITSTIFFRLTRHFSHNWFVQCSRHSQTAKSVLFKTLCFTGARKRTLQLGWRHSWTQRNDTPTFLPQDCSNGYYACCFSDQG